MVFQSFALYPHLTVRKNMGFGLSLARMPKAQIAAEVDKVAAVLQLEPLLDRRPKALSGGQRLRVAIGRAIERDPGVFLFDEPLSNLDAALRSQMRLQITDLHARLGANVIYATHDQVEAMTMADKIVVLNAGRIEQVGTPMEVYERPATPFVADFIGSPKMNLFEGEVVRTVGREVYGIRPEHLNVSDDSGTRDGIVRHVERLGADTILLVDVASLGAVLARIDGHRTYAPGATVHRTPDAGRRTRVSLSGLNDSGGEVGTSRCSSTVHQPYSRWRPEPLLSSGHSEKTRVDIRGYAAGISSRFCAMNSTGGMFPRPAWGRW
ncbi:Maltose/maltodextrin import ATP-binding protein MalK [Roseisalinus antarcticus]|uniref:Maltose/maltodextrin import ATP-binding protein MalK n=1 Tax=Roseisalinus antarcticus TaxID=254357 RepID=A0A1Y5TUM8_9RHOB|nr:Maltose/maltodextrin import ATP-binding protein MalK [Roseisalinus antarcticus]